MGNREVDLPSTEMNQAEIPVSADDSVDRIQRNALILANLTAFAWFTTQSVMAIRPGLVATVQQRVLHLGFALVLGFLLAAWSSPRRWMALANFVAAALSGGVQIFAFFEVHKQQYLQGLYTAESLVIAAVGTLIVFYVTYRSFGWALPVLGTLFMAWAWLGSMLPGVMRIPSVAWDRLLPGTYFSGEGVHGVPLDASTRYIFMFIVFGAFLVEFGATGFLLRIVQRLFSRTRGGAGKMSVASSLLFGVVSDSTTANVATTGVIMIPAMKRSGFSREQAAAIESAASVGGQLMPPVMGTVAFIMVAMTGIPYHVIAIAALAPALLYYTALFLSVDRVAAKRGLGPSDLTFQPLSKREWVWSSILYGAPLTVLIYLLVFARWQPSESVTWALLLLVGLYTIANPNRGTLRRCSHAIIKGTRRAVIVAVVTAVVGTLIGPIFMSGLGLRLTSIFLGISDDNVWILLFMTMLASFILGSGLPSSAAYVLLAILVAPSLTAFGLPVLAAHMFIMYHGIMGGVSPPTMATVFVAAGIAESKPFKTGFMAMGFGIGGFVVPFLFHMYPGTLLSAESFWGNAGNILLALAIVLSLGAAADGWILRRLNPIERLILLAGGLTMVAPGIGTLGLGAAIAAGGVALHVARNRRVLAEILDSRADKQGLDEQWLDEQDETVVSRKEYL